MPIEKLDSAFVKSADMWLIQTQQFFYHKINSIEERQ